MKLGYFGSSFDPPTVAHMHTATNLAELFGLDGVILGPCSNIRPDKKLQTADFHRINMLDLAIDNNPMFTVDRFEMDQEASKVFSYFTMEYLKKKHPNDEIYFMMGADLLISLGMGDWDYGKEFIENNQCIVASRSGKDLEAIMNFYPFLYPHKEQFHLFQEKEDLAISSTYIRKEIAEGRSPRYLLPNGVFDYIKAKDLYVSTPSSLEGRICLGHQTYDIYERINVDSSDEPIAKIMEKELNCFIDISENGDYGLLIGHLELRIKRQMSLAPLFERIIPVEIKIPKSRYFDVTKLRCKIEHFEVESLSMRSLNLTGRLVVYEEQ
jgi:nicotinate-nucleotide adenylyltransferase